MIRMTLDPDIVRLGALTLGWHGLFTALAVLVAVVIGVRRVEAKGVSGEDATKLVYWCLGGGIIGARVLHVLDHLSYYGSHPAQTLAVWEGGIAVYGAFLGGIIGGLIAVRLMHLPAWPLLDAAAPAMLVGQAIGRIGCFINGDAWGAPTGGNWGVVYDNPRDLIPPQLLGVPTHPYPLYEIAADLALVGLLYLLHRRFRVPGQEFLVAAIGYGIIRFGLTYFRQEPVILGGLQEAQVIAIITTVLSLGLLIARLAPRRAEQVAVPNA